MHYQPTLGFKQMWSAIGKSIFPVFLKVFTNFNLFCKHKYLTETLISPVFSKHYQKNRYLSGPVDKIL